MKKCSVTPYNGKDKFVFVSYAHKDKARVFPIIERLAREGCRIWYDEGIDPGSEWPEIIADHLNESAMCLAFITESSLNSHNCRREINFALAKKKALIAIVLEEVQMSPGMEMQLSVMQSIYKYTYSSEEDFFRKLLEANAIRPCMGKPDPSVRISRLEEYAEESQEEPAAFRAQESLRPTQTPKKAGAAEKKANRLPLILGGAVAAVVLLVLLAVLLLPKQPGPDNPPATGEPEKTEQTSPQTEEPATEAEKEPVMSDKLLDFTFRLEGEMYQLPCSYETFTKKGWTISETDCTPDTPVMGNDFEVFSMSRNGKKILLTAYNASGNAKKISDCPVGGLQCEGSYGTQLELPKGITLSSTAEQIKAAYGSPNSHNQGSGYESLSYESSGVSYSYAKFYCSEEADACYVELKHYVATEEDATQNKEERPAYLASYQAPTALGQDPVSGIVELEGKLYQLPAPLDAFTQNGWEISQKPAGVVAGATESVELQMDGKTVYLRVYNNWEYQTSAENCMVTRIAVSEEDGARLCLPCQNGALPIGADKAAVDACTQGLFSVYSGSSAYSYDYSEYKDRELALSLRVDVSSGKLSDMAISREDWHYGEN